MVLRLCESLCFKLHYHILDLNIKRKVIRRKKINYNDKVFKLKPMELQVESKNEKYMFKDLFWLLISPCIFIVLKFLMFLDYIRIKINIILKKLKKSKNNLKNKNKN